MLIAVSSFGESLRWDNLTAPAEAVFNWMNGRLEGWFHFDGVVSTGSTTGFHFDGAQYKRKAQPPSFDRARVEC